MADHDNLCDDEYPGSDLFAGQLCALPAGHQGEHRSEAQVAGTGYRALLEWGPQ
jgi:hypothetical protein